MNTSQFHGDHQASPQQLNDHQSSSKFDQEAANSPTHSSSAILGYTVRNSKSVLTHEDGKLAAMEGFLHELSRMPSYLLPSPDSDTLNCSSLGAKKAT